MSTICSFIEIQFQCFVVGLNSLAGWSLCCDKQPVVASTDSHLHVLLVLLVLIVPLVQGVFLTGTPLKSMENLGQVNLRRRRSAQIHLTQPRLTFLYLGILGGVPVKNTLYMSCLDCDKQCSCLQIHTHEVKSRPPPLSQRQDQNQQRNSGTIYRVQFSTNLLVSRRYVGDTHVTPKMTPNGKHIDFHSPGALEGYKLQQLNRIE